MMPSTDVESLLSGLDLVKSENTDLKLSSTCLVAAATILPLPLVSISVTWANAPMVGATLVTLAGMVTSLPSVSLTVRVAPESLEPAASVTAAEPAAEPALVAAPEQPVSRALDIKSAPSPATANCRTFMSFILPCLLPLSASRSLGRGCSMAARRYRSPTRQYRSSN